MMFVWCNGKEVQGSLAELAETKKSAEFTANWKVKEEKKVRSGAAKSLCILRPELIQLFGIIMRLLSPCVLLAWPESVRPSRAWRRGASRPPHPHARGPAGEDRSNGGRLQLRHLAFIASEFVLGR